MKVYKVMMSLRMSLTVPLLFLIFISGVGAQDDWGVTYRPESICALKESTVIMDCTYSYPEGHTVKTAFWTKSWPPAAGEPPDLLNDTEYRDRVQYLGDKQHDCRLSLRDVRESDQRKYYFRFITDKEGGKYTGAAGVDLSVTGLQVEVPERVMEGDNATLTCKTNCSLTGSPSFTWYRNGQHISSSTEQLYLQSVSRKDAGRYSCGVDQKLRSPEVTLNVLYLQVEGPEEVKERDNVTLTCKPSLTLPSTTTFTWYRNGTTLSSSTEQLYLQSVSREDAGRYSCAVLDQNLHSPEVTLSVRYLQVEGPERVMEGDKVTLTCKPSFTLPSTTTFTWYRNGTTLSSSTEQLYLQSVSREAAGRYSCAVLDQKLHSPEVSLNVTYPPKNVSVSISPSGEIVEGSSVNLTCSSDGNPPVQNYTWFKEGGGSSPVGSGNRFTAVESGSYYCVAQNKYGSQTAAAVLVTPGGVQSSVVFAAVGVSAACLLVVGVIFFVRRKRSGNLPDGADPRQDNIYSNVGEISAVSDSTPDPDPSNQDDVQYATVVPRRLKPSPPVNASSNGTDEEVQYATVQHHRDKVVKKPAGDDVEYASVRFSRSGARGRSNAPLIEDDSVIYSSLK